MYARSRRIACSELLGNFGNFGNCRAERATFFRQFLGKTV